MDIQETCIQKTSVNYNIQKKVAHKPMILIRKISTGVFIMWCGQAPIQMIAEYASIVKMICPTTRPNMDVERAGKNLRKCISHHNNWNKVRGRRWIDVWRDSLDMDQSHDFYHDTHHGRQPNHPFSTTNAHDSSNYYRCHTLDNDIFIHGRGRICEK